MLPFLIFGNLTAEVDHLESGRKRIIDIMTNEELGVAAFNKKNITQAETRNLAQDLNIADIAEFFNCKTLIGKTFMVETLKQPINTHEADGILRRRQNCVKLLVENPDLKKEVEELLDAAKQEEQQVIELFSDHFKAKTCPELKAIEGLRQQQHPLTPLVEYLYLNPTGKTISTSMNLISFPLMIWATGKVGHLAYVQAQNNQEYGTLALYSIYCAAVSALTGRELYKDYTSGAEKRERIHSLNRLITIAETSEDLVRKYNLHVQFKISNITNESGLRLIDKIKHGRYKHKDTKLFALPMVHSFMYEVFKEEKHLAQVFACIAELDAYNALASKIVQSQNEKNKFCYVSFVESEKPTIHSKAVWNVLVKDAVSNSLSEKRHIILTGPNMGGKTTAIRALLQNIVLGQTFGIAAAESFEFTQFDVIHSYLNISDDLKNGLSLFASEVKRAQEIVQKINALDQKQKYFFALDELFTGTVAEDGETCAYNFVKKIASSQRTQFVYATHFKRLKELGHDNDVCVNYKVDAPIKNENGKLVFPFTVSQGASDSNVALDLAREANLFE